MDHQILIIAMVAFGLFFGWTIGSHYRLVPFCRAGKGVSSRPPPIRRLRNRIGSCRGKIAVLWAIEDIPLMVMGCHGMGWVEGMLWGRVSQKVLESSEKPVLVVK